MDALNRARRPVRNEFQKLYNEMQTLLQDPVDKEAVNVQFHLIQDSFNRLADLDQRAEDLLVEKNASEQEQDEEFGRILETRRKMETIKVKVDKLLTTRIPQPDDSQSVSVVARMEGLRIRLPKFEFRKFGGNLMDWLGFWSQFQKIDSEPELDGSDKLGYLLMALEEGTEAYDIVSAFPQTNENYTEAVAALKRRYGDNDVLLQVYVRELLTLVISNVNNTNKQPFAKLYSRLDSHLRALKTLNLEKADPATWLYPLVESCLPEDILLAWQRSPLIKSDGNSMNPPKSRLDFLLEFMEKEVEIRQRMDIAREGFAEKPIQRTVTFKRKLEVGQSQNIRKKFKNDGYPTVSGFQNVDSRKPNNIKNAKEGSMWLDEKPGRYCIFCERSGHLSADCRSSRFKSFDERRMIAKKHGVCFLCLKNNCFSTRCKSNTKCKLCEGRHQTVMCRQYGGVSHDSAFQSQSKEMDKGSRDPITHAKSSITLSNRVTLQTAQAILRNGEKGRVVRLFFDGGSERSYIIKSTALEMGLRSVGTEVVAHELFGGHVTERKTHHKYKILLQSLDNANSCELVVRDQQKISESIPRLTKMTALWQELRDRGMELSDVGVGCPSVDVLIGADNFGRVLTGRMKVLSSGQVALESVFGWTVLGENAEYFVNKSNASIMSGMALSDYSVTQLWDLDTIGVCDSVTVKSAQQQEEEVKQQFFLSLRRTHDGRYCVRLPWKNGHPPLPSNRIEAEKRLLKLSKRLKESGMFHIYGQLFLDWEKEGFIETVPVNQSYSGGTRIQSTIVPENQSCKSSTIMKLKSVPENLSTKSVSVVSPKCVPENNSNSKIHYVPHRAVVKPESLTTPVRPVFDASCKIGNVPSLNDCLHTGSNKIQLIPEILYRFREKRIGFVSDIRKAFQMIEVAECDRDAMRFLWWNDSGEMMIYRHRRVMFGATCSPFILGAVLEHHLCNLADKEVGMKLLQSMYVDNCVLSESTVDEYRRFREASTNALSECGMDLRMWLSNVDEMEDTNTLNISVLGMMWDRKEDTLYVKTSGIKEPEKVTKKALLSVAHQVFDPVGVVCPAVIPIKILLQQTWLNNLKWNEPLPEEDINKFRSWMSELALLEQIRIPRCFMSLQVDRKHWSINTFTDASIYAYGTVVYLRVEFNGQVSVQLIAAKARVAPVKRVTINRLELLGCLLGARVSASVRKALELENVEEFLWTDSTTALSWIRRDDQWGTFVGNRTMEINRLTSRNKWRHVPGSLNPADIVSRGVSPSHLLQSKWWEGPSWLYQPGCLPVWEEAVNEEDVEKEKKKSSLIGASTISMSVLQYEKKDRSWSSWVRVTAYAKRFLHNFKVKYSSKYKNEQKRNGPLSIQELKEAEVTVVYGIQQDAFGSSEKGRFNGLDVKTDEKGLLHVQTRTIMRRDLVCSNTPLLLPGDHPLVKRLIMDFHCTCVHAGVGFMVTMLRKKFWIIKARKSIRHVISKCIRCRRLNARPAETVTAPLPLDRIKDAQVFEVVGVDLAGPLLLRNGKKTWLVIFTCAVYRAVHLDVVDSLTTVAFLKCLRKFIEKYGRPVTIYSDNGTNFRGSDNLFRKLDWTRIENEEGVQRIKWKFNPPGAPWWGSWWERLIRTLKDLLRRTVGNASLNYTELKEIVKKIEDVMNERPLTYVSEDLNDLEPLTPKHFIRPSGCYKFPEGDLTDSEKLRLRAKYMSTLWKELKHRFQKEYLSMLVSTSRKKPTRPLREGELVVVGNDTTRKVNWPLGRIVKLFPGKDGVARFAHVKVQDGDSPQSKIIEQAVQRLHPLEMDIGSPGGSAVVHQN